MSTTEYPVLVAVPGRSEKVQVGTAIREGDSFVLRLGELSLGAPVEASPARRAASPPPSGATQVIFPNYGRRKGEPIFDAPVSDLEYYANGCRRTLDDPGKSRWHDKERVLLASIEAEIARQGGAPPPPSTAGGEEEFTPVFDGNDDDIPF